MKKGLYFIVFLLVILLLSACGVSRNTYRVPLMPNNAKETEIPIGIQKECKTVLPTIQPTEADQLRKETVKKMLDQGVNLAPILTEPTIRSEVAVITTATKKKPDSTDFEKRLTKQLISGDNNNENIDIMSNIIKSSLEGKKKSQYLWGGNVQGIFLKELGVMFSFGDRYFRDIFSDDFHIWTFPEGNVKAEVFIENSMKKKAESSKKFRENLSNFEEDIIKVIGQYGAASLKFLPENQSVFVLFGTKGYSDKDISNVMIRLRKSDLIDFSRDRLNLENLRKRAQIVEY